MIKIAVVGGGINGLCTAWQLAKAGYRVELFERDRLMQATSKSSSKLLHGGLRYLENYEFRLVGEALRERAWWLRQAPHLANPIKLYLPVYTYSQRAAWLMRSGLWLYDRLAGAHNINNHNRLSLNSFKAQTPELHHEDLKAGFTFYDAQMDDYQLGLWVAEQAQATGVSLREHCEVIHIDEQGKLEYITKNKAGGGTRQFDRIINVTGPWSESILQNSGIHSKYQLDLVRGSHILFEEPLKQGYFLEVPNERRIFFALPYQGKTLIGTTEIRQAIDDPIEITEEEKYYLLDVFNHYFRSKKRFNDIAGSFAGLRPLIKSTASPEKTTREYALENRGRVLTIFGGKWTTSRALANKVVKEITAM